jgi:hypothetical protein
VTSRSALAAGLSVLAALTATAAAWAAPAPATTSVYASAAANRAAARAVATRLLRELRLPPGARRSPGEPAGADGLLSQPGYDEATPNLLDAHEWWTTRQSPAAVVGYVAHHLPSGVAGSGGTSGGSSGLQERNWELAPVAGVTRRVLSVSVVRTNSGQTAVRLDGEAVWQTPRPAWERIPAGVTSASFTGRGPAPSGRGGAPSHAQTVPGATARALAAAINGFELFPPGVYSCPADFGESITISFFGAGHRRLATATESPTGCAAVRLTIAGRTGPELSDGAPGRFTVTEEVLRLRAIASCTRSQLIPGRQANSLRPGDPAIIFSFRNRSRALCSLRGFARLALIDGAGHRTGGQDRDAGVTQLRRQGVGATTVLYPGSAAQFTAGYKSCPSRPPATRARVRLPGIASPFSLRFSTTGAAPTPPTPCPSGLSLSPLSAAN